MNDPKKSTHRAGQEIALTVSQQRDCPLFRKGDKMVIQMPEIHTGSGSICIYAAAQALPMLAAAVRAGKRAEEVLPHFRCVSGGEHFADFDIASRAVVESVETKAARALRQSRYFAELSRLEMDQIVSRLQTDQYFPRSLLLEQGQPADRIVLLTRGIAEIVMAEPTGFERVLGRVNEGELFGSELLPANSLTTASLRCLTIVQASVLLRKDIIELMTSCEELAEHLQNFGFPTPARR